jgi:hypothetical protein
MSPFPLRALPMGMRLSLTALVLVLLGGYAASGLHMADHHGPRDGKEGLTPTDIEGVYHGVVSPSPLRVALEAGHPKGDQAIPEEERAALLAWLGSGRIVEDWDNLDLGDMVPADLLDVNCLSCHARGAEPELKAEPMLEYLDDIRAVAFDNEVSPTDLKLLLASTHAHSLSLFTVALGAVLLLWGTRFGRGLVSLVSLLVSAGLLLDLVSWWLARDSAAWVNGILVGGAAHAGGVGLAGLLVLLDLWLPARKD